MKNKLTGKPVYRQEISDAENQSSIEMEAIFLRLPLPIK